MLKVAGSSVLFAVIVVGCASTILSNERIRDNTAGILGLTPDQITIENRRSEVTNTYYVAKTRSGDEYACVINGGTILAFGMTNPPVCNKKSAGPK